MKRKRKEREKNLAGEFVLYDGRLLPGKPRHG